MSDLNEKFEELKNDTVDTTAQFDTADIEKNKGLSVLSYLSFLVIIPLLAAKDSKFARFHVNQGIVLFIVELLGEAVFRVLARIPVISFIANIANWIFGVLILVLAIVGIVNAVNGKAKTLPVIGKFEIIK